MLLGIDCGNTAVKAVVFSTDGQTIATKSRRTEPLQPGPNRVEHDMDRLWQLSCEAISDVLEAVPGGARAVDAIGVTAHGDGLYVADRAGKPLGNGIQSVDSRAQGITAGWASDGVLDQVASITAQRPYPYAASTLLEWIRRNEPERYAAIRHVFFCKDWVRYRLTGVIATDPTDASTAFTEARTQHYSDELLELLGLTDIRPALPEILPSSAVIGTVSAEAAAVTGLRTGTPVAGGMHDCTVSAIGLGNLESGAVSITAGTFSINETLSDRLTVDPRWTARAGLRPGQWMNMSISPASSNNTDWFLRQAYAAEWDDAARSGRSVWKTIEADLTAPVTADAPLFHPFLYGSPYEAPASAAFFGLRSWHNRADMLRAVVEGAVFNHRFHVDALRSSFPISRAGITGGGSSQSRSAQLFADALGLTVDVPRTTEASALGAALLAGVGIGVAPSLAEAVSRACRVEARYEPDAERHAALSERFARYIALAEAVLGVSAREAAASATSLQRMTP
jgi:L-xylulokinase